MAAQLGLTRRQWLGATLLIPLCSARVASAHSAASHDSRTMMGTRVDITVQHRDAALRENAVRAAWAEMGRLVGNLSRYEPDSVVAMLQRRAGRTPVRITPDVMNVLSEARSLSRISGGAFDITVGAYAGWRFDAEHAAMPTPADLAQARTLVDHRDVVLDTRHGTAFLRRPHMRLDLGGIAKLPILEAGMAVLRLHGVQDAQIDGGGDVITSGQWQGRDWRVGIRDAHAPDRLAGVVTLRDGVVASSGDYERCFERGGQRYHHILDTRTGMPTQGPNGVVLVAREGAAVNGRGAALMAANPAQRAAILGDLQSRADVLVFERDRTRWHTAGMTRWLNA